LNSEILPDAAERLVKRACMRRAENLSLAEDIWLRIFIGLISANGNAGLRQGETPADRVDAYAALADAALPVALARLKELA